MASFLSCIEPSSLRHKAAVDRLVAKATVHYAWPLNNDLLHPSQHWLTLRKPLRSDLKPVDIISQWRDDWSSASVVICDLVQDPTICPPGFSLPRKQWCTLNHFRTNQGHCGTCRKLRHLADSDVCACGATQTMSHIVESCPLTKVDAGLKKVHTVDDESVYWLSSYGT